MMPSTSIRAGAALGACALAVTATPSVAAAPTATPPTAVAKPVAKHRTPSRLELGHRRLDVPVGSDAVVRGRVRAYAPRLVRLQRRDGDAWKTIASDRPDRRGRFALRDRGHAAGSAEVRVRYSGDENNMLSSKEIGRLNVFRSVSASWYGPGLFGAKTACGGTLDGAVLGVAHKSLPCGTRLTLRNGSHTVRVRVIDRGPFVGGRELDLTPATKAALHFGSTGQIGMTA